LAYFPIFAFVIDGSKLGLLVAPQYYIAVH